MKIKPEKEIVVGSHIKLAKTGLRKVPVLVEGNSYYVSFGMNKAMPCILLEVIDIGSGLQQVKIGLKDNSPLGYGDVNIVYSDEIGTTPEEAVINEHTF